MGAGATRRELLSRAAKATPSSRPETDASRLERLMRVELLLLFCYRHVLSSSILPGHSRRALAPLRAHEQAHVQALGVRLSLLGGLIPAPPASVAEADRDLAHRNVGGRLGQLRGADDALSLLLAVEQVTIGAYFVALRKLQDAGLIALAAAIMANDAQHEAVIGEIQHPGKGPWAAPYGLVQGVQ